MNKKGFTLVELLLVIVIVGMILILAIPGILDSIEENRSSSAKSVEKLLIQNLDMYNNDKMYEGYKYYEVTNASGNKIQIYDRASDLWEIDKQIQPGSYCNYVDYQDLINSNNDIKLGECLLTSSDKALVIERVVESEGYNKYKATYKYYADVVCGKRLPSNDGYSLSGGYDEGDVYYKSTSKPNCIEK